MPDELKCKFKLDTARKLGYLFVCTLNHVHSHTDGLDSPYYSISRWHFFGIKEYIRYGLDAPHSNHDGPGY